MKGNSESDVMSTTTCTICTSAINYSCGVSDIWFFYFFFPHTKQIFCHRVETSFSTPESSMHCQEQSLAFPLFSVKKFKRIFNEREKYENATFARRTLKIFFDCKCAVLVLKQTLQSLLFISQYSCYLEWSKMNDCLCYKTHSMEIYTSMLHFLIKSKIWLQNAA